MAIPKKPRKCRACKCDFQPSKPLQNTCSFECHVQLGIAIAEKSKARREAEVRKLIAKEDKARREKLKSRSDWMKEAQAEFNLFIRVRDRIAGHRCISSGKHLDWSGNAVDAGHYRSTGSAPHLRFDERNCHAQSKHDNRYLSGNAVDYRIGLIARIGLKAVEDLEADQAPRKHSIEDLKQIIATYKQKRKDLINGQTA